MNELFDEFHGLGRFEGKPIPGGFAKLEEVFKTKWRQGFSRGQKKEWSRLTMTIRGINAHIDELGGDRQRALDNLDLHIQDGDPHVRKGCTYKRPRSTQVCSYKHSGLIDDSLMDYNPTFY